MPTVVTQDMIDKILKMHKDGMTGSSIAKQLGIGKTTVNKYIRIYSEDKVVSTDKFTNDFVDRMTQEYKEGTPITKLASKYKVSASSLATYIYRNLNVEESQENKVTSNKELREDKPMKKEEKAIVPQENMDKVPETDNLSRRKSLVEEYIQEEKNINSMVALFKSGTSLSKIASMTGLSRSTVTRTIYARLGLSKQPEIKREVKPKSSVVVAVKKPVWTLEDKIEFCNEKYGEGKWRFLTKDEVLDCLKADGIIV